MQWDLRNFDYEEYALQLKAERVEYYNTVFAVVFLPNGASNLKLAAAGYSNGDIRIFSVSDTIQTWLTQHKSSRHIFSFQAHQSAVNCLELLVGDIPLLVSGGEDEFLRVWDVRAIHEAVAAGGGVAEGLQPSFELRLPRTDSPLGIVPHTATVMTLAADDAGSRVFIGSGDGACHVLNLQQGSGDLVSRVGHAASVLGTDYCPAIQSLASCSEDGTVRTWDTRGLNCTRVLNPWQGVWIQDQKRKILECVTEPPVTAVRYDKLGNWLICSSGDVGLTCMSTAADTFTQHSIDCRTQYLYLDGGEILMVGTEPYLTRFNFCFDVISRTPIRPSSAFWIDVDPQQKTIAVSGSNGCIDFLSPTGSRIGAVYPFCPDINEKWVGKDVKPATIKA